MSETELKFQVDPDRASAVDAALRAAGARATSIDSHYFDTADGRLAKSGLALRTRRVDGRWEQTLKASGSDVGTREEETVARPGAWEPPGPPVDPRLHRGTRAGKRLEQVLKDGASEPLLHVHSSFVRRRAAVIDSEGVRIEVALDQGELRSGDRSHALCEVEYELKSPGSALALLSIARSGIVEHGMCLSTVSKSALGHRLSQGGVVPAATRARNPDFGAGAAAPKMVRAVVAACLDQVLANASELAAGRVSDEVVHQLRIGLRRLRTASRELGSLTPALGRAWAGPLDNAFRQLGAYRDRRTVLASLQTRLAEADSPLPELAAGAEADTDPIDVVRTPYFQNALLGVLAFTLDEVASAGADESADAVAHVDKRLDRLHRHLRTAGQDFESLPAEEKHRARKRLKRLRYLSELVRPLYRRGRVENYLDQLKPAQDELGVYMDLVVGTQLAGDEAVQGNSPAWFNVGWLSAEMRGSAMRCRKSLVRASRARPFWRDKGR